MALNGNLKLETFITKFDHIKALLKGHTGANVALAEFESRSHVK